MSKFNNRTNINNYILLKRTENTENKAQQLDQLLSDLQRKADLLDKEIKIAKMNNEVIIQSLCDYLTTDELTVDINTFCVLMNKITSDESGAATISVPMNVVLGKGSFTPIINPNVESLKFNETVVFDTMNLSNAFKGNQVIRTLDISNWSFNSSDNIKVSNMFKSCVNLTTIIIVEKVMYDIISKTNSGITVDEGIDIGDSEDVKIYTIEWDGDQGTITGVESN